VSLAVVVAACVATADAGRSSSSKSGATTIRKGGSMTVLAYAGYDGAWPAGLDPATDTNGAANQSYMTSIFGQLFELREQGDIVPDLATGYKFSKDAKTVTIHLRKGVKFSDGTPFNAAAVVWNVNRDLASSCTCKPTWPLDKNTPITAPNTHTVVFHLTQPYAAFIHSLIVSNVAWIASPSAFQKMGADAFKLKPVGAGPFTVVSDTPNSELVLKRNPNYWAKGLPYLNNLTFKTISGDAAALQALEAGQAQAYLGLSTTDLIIAAQKNQKLQVTIPKPTSPYDIQLNTSIPPFNNKQARLAIYYATDSQAINKNLFHGLFKLTEGFTAPGGLFYQPNVPGYPQYNLAKAKQIVQQLGGLDVDLGTINIETASRTITALQTMWGQAGIKVTTHSYDLLPLIQAFTGGKWQAMLQTDGSWDPAAGVGVMFRFASTSPFSGVHDPKLDAILNQAAATLRTKDRGKLYAQAAKYMADNAYGPNMFAFAGAVVTTRGVVGPGLSTALPAAVVQPTVPWEQVGYGT
jgi:peptide/nickel transport system substrate-binding protein